MLEISIANLPIYIMTIHDLSQDIVPVLSLIVATIGLLLIWWQIRAAVTAINVSVDSLNQARAAFQQTTEWNRITSTYTFFDLDRNSQIEKRLYEAGAKIGLRFDKELTTEEISKIVETPALFLAAKDFLNDFESYCAAYRVGALHRELAFQLLGTRISKEYFVFAPFVEYLRNQFKDIGILHELEVTANEWSDRLKKEEDERAAVLKRLMVGVKETENL